MSHIHFTSQLALAVGKFWEHLDIGTVVDRLQVVTCFQESGKYGFVDLLYVYLHALVCYAVQKSNRAWLFTTISGHVVLRL